MEAYMAAILVPLVLIIVNQNVLEVTSQNVGHEISDECGRSLPLIVPLVHNGDNVERGEWPWLAALYQRQAGLAFKCGAVLVTGSHVITAGHCVHPPAMKHPIPAAKFVVGLGVHNIYSFGDEEEGKQSRKLSRIVIHPEFNKTKILNNDIAVLVLASPVIFNQFVRPVCLWNAESSPATLTGSSGTVVGWGWTETDEVPSDLPKKVRMPIVSQEECLRSNADFVYITSFNTFCAGNRDGSGPCKGDSGGGLYIFDSASRRWVLRGLVSTSLAYAGDCDLTNYVVFTNVAKFSDWLTQTIDTGFSKPSPTSALVPHVQIPDDDQLRSISERKCTDYTKYVRRKVSAMVNQDRISLAVPECEFRNIPLIAGGDIAMPAEFPHMAAVYQKESDGESTKDVFLCGGTLISETFVLTSGKCTTFENSLFVRLSDVYRQHDLDVRVDDDHAVERAVAVAIPHPQYKPPALYHDIGLLRLALRVTFNLNLRPACLPQSSPNNTARVVATGWGASDYVSGLSDVLRKVSVRLVPDEICSRQWVNVVEIQRVPNAKMPRGIDHQTMMCAGERGKGTCIGDNGGPLTIRNEKNECIHHVVGVTSITSGKACGFGTSIYTRVSFYVPWIESVVWPEID